jgi:endonuclease/exonuclease/phosphatase family metal-dependent hydrolase
MVYLAATTIAASALANDGPWKLMSFNIRYSHGGLDEAKTENNWTDPEFPRRERVFRVIRDYIPDVLGVQEARHLQIVDLQRALPEYDFYGVGRDDGKHGGEYTGIYYRKQRLERIKEGSFWLSETPEKPGTTFFKAPNAVPRMASWVQLRDKPTGQKFVVLNTHWDHISDEARRKSAALIHSRLAEVSNGLPIIVMGDLNVPEDAPATKTLLAADGSTDFVLIDGYRKLHPTRSTEEATFNGWEAKTAGSRIDFILHSRDFAPTAAEVVRTTYDGRLPSDHYPVTATLQRSK